MSKKLEECKDEEWDVNASIFYNDIEKLYGMYEDDVPDDMKEYYNNIYYDI